MDIQTAVDAPRFHHQWKPEYIYIEESLYYNSLVDSLVNLGHQTKLRSSIGHVNAIMFNNKTVDLGADKRGDNCGQLSK